MASDLGLPVKNFFIILDVKTTQEGFLEVSKILGKILVGF